MLFCAPMDIQSYLKKHRLSQEQFARKLEVTQGAVWQWINGRANVSPQMAKKIEKATRGQIKRHELRPDVYEPA